MLHRLDLRGTAVGDLHALRASLPRPQAAKEPPVADVQAILADVRARGDAAVRAYTERFDGAVVDDLRVPPAGLDRALAGLASSVREALEAARASIEVFHRGQVRGEAGEAATASSAGPYTAT